MRAGGFVTPFILPPTNAASSIPRTRATIVSVLLSRIAGPRNYGPVFGLIGIGNSLGAAAGPWLSGAIFDRTDSYLALYFVTLGFAAAGLAALSVFLLASRAGRPGG